MILILTTEETEGDPGRWSQVVHAGAHEFRCQIAFLGTPECDSCPVDPPPIPSFLFSIGAIISSRLGQNPRFSQPQTGGAKAGLVISEL